MITLDLSRNIPCRHIFWVRLGFSMHLLPNWITMEAITFILDMSSHATIVTIHWWRVSSSLEIFVKTSSVPDIAIYSVLDYCWPLTSLWFSSWSNIAEHWLKDGRGFMGKIWPLILVNWSLRPIKNCVSWIIWLC